MCVRLIYKYIPSVNIVNKNIFQIQLINPTIPNLYNIY